MVLTALPPQWRVPVRPVTRSAPAEIEAVETDRQNRGSIEQTDVVAPTSELREGEGGASGLASDGGTAEQPAAPTGFDEGPADAGEPVDVTSPGSNRETGRIEPGSGALDRSSRPRATLAHSRRLGLGPAYHGPLPEAVSAEHDRAERDNMEEVDESAAAPKVAEPPKPGESAR